MKAFVTGLILVASLASTLNLAQAETLSSTDNGQQALKSDAGELSFHCVKRPYRPGFACWRN